MSNAIRVPKTTAHLTFLKGMVTGETEPPPVARLIGFRVVKAEIGAAEFEMEASSRHANPMGTLHGGILCDLGDAAMGFAIATTLEDDESFTTLSLTSNFFKPIWNSRLTATARVTRRTRSIGYIECLVHDEKGSLVARLDSTCMVLRGEDAKGR